jgi:uncharacterized protein (DUF885 family)
MGESPKIKMKKIYLILSLFGILMSCNKESKNAEVDAVFKEYYAERSIMFPLEATVQGLQGHNAELAIDISESHIKNLNLFYTKFLEKANAINAEKLTLEENKNLEALKFVLKTEKALNDSPSYLMPFNQFTGLPLTMAQMGSGDGSQPFETKEDFYNWIKRTEKFAVWTDTAIANFNKGINSNVVLPASLVVKMIPQMRDLAKPDSASNAFFGAFKKIPASLSAEEKSKLILDLKNALSKNIIPSYQKLGDYLQNTYLKKARKTSGIGELKGGNTYYKDLTTYWTTTSKTPEEIYQTGLLEVARIKKEMETVQNSVGFKGELKAFFENVKTDPKLMPYKKPAEVLTAFADIQKTIDPKLKELFGTVPKTKFEIKQTEAFREASASAEYMQGTPDGKRGGIFYVPIPDATKFNVTSGMESLFLHEAIPGHHYQVSLQQENKNLPDFMKFAWFGAYGEGWALYCESLGKELGLYSNPYQYFGALGDEMHRAIRLVVDVGLHTKGWSREQAIKYMMDNEAISEQGATAEIERYMAIPGQALSYKIGALKIRELRIKYEAKPGFKIAEFHDYILSLGCVPLEVLEKSLEKWAKK